MKLGGFCVQAGCRLRVYIGLQGTEVMAACRLTGDREVMAACRLAGDRGDGCM